MDELRLVTAANLIALRTASGLTQAGLGEKISYSDKTVSKWERGEALPDAYVLTQLAEIFGVSVDYILSPHDKEEVPAGLPVADEGPRFSAGVIIAISDLGIMTSALLAFVILWILGTVEWRIFLIGIALSLLNTLVLDCVFYKGSGLKYIISAFVLSMFVLIYFIIPVHKPWQLFLVALPAIVIVFLAFEIRIKSPKRRKNKTN